MIKLDGGLSTALENNGNKLNTSLWTGEMIRTKYRKGKLDKAKIKLFEGIHSDWAWAEIDGVWFDNYNLLNVYFEKNGDSEFSGKKSKSDRTLTEWITTQRRANKRGIISKERINLLNSINFRWEPLDPWGESFKDLKNYVKREGNALVHWQHTENGKVLGKWVSHQRANYKSGRLTKDKISKLEKLPGWTWAPLNKK